MHIMDDISDDTKVAWRHVEITSVVRRRRWSDEEKGRIVAEAIAPGAVIADVARRHDLAPQQLSNWIRAAKEGQFTLPADEMRCRPLCLWFQWNRHSRAKSRMNVALPPSRS